MCNKDDNVYTDHPHDILHDLDDTEDNWTCSLQYNEPPQGAEELHSSTIGEHHHPNIDSIVPREVCKISTRVKEVIRLTGNGGSTNKKKMCKKGENTPERLEVVWPEQVYDVIKKEVDS